MKKVEEYLVLRDGSSTIRLLKLECHSVIGNRKAILRFPGSMEEYEIVNIRTLKGRFKDVIEYELGKCIKCLKVDDFVKEVK